MQYNLIHGDCLKELPRLGRYDCVFADVFDNIGRKYNGFTDIMPVWEYEDFLDNLIERLARLTSIIWISFNAKWTAKMGVIFDNFLDESTSWEAKFCVQAHTFGQYNKHDLANNHRPLWRLKQKDAKLYPEAIKVPSWRQRNGDKRAAAGGRVPGDVIVMDSEVQSGTVFDFPRVTGNSAQKCDWGDNQLHEGLVERCIKLSTPEGGSVLDPFGGTGTTLRVCKKINRSCTLIELSEFYCQKISEENNVPISSSVAA